MPHSLQAAYLFSSPTNVAFHNLYEPMTDLRLIHYAFSTQMFKRLFGKVFSDYAVSSTRFNHMAKFRLQKLSKSLPLLRKFGSLVIAYGRKT